MFKKGPIELLLMRVSFLVLFSHKLCQLRCQRAFPISLNDKHLGFQLNKLCINNKMFWHPFQTIFILTVNYCKLTILAGDGWSQPLSAIEVTPTFKLSIKGDIKILQILLQICGYYSIQNPLCSRNCFLFDLSECKMNSKWIWYLYSYYLFASKRQYSSPP